jgi:hypothetical protein
MQQTLKPNRIILWLGDTNMDIPLTLRAQERRGLEIKYCEDIRSYKKLIPALKEFPESIIITVDDDCLYHFSIIENLVKAYKKNPSNIYALRIHRMKLNSKGILNNYSQWDWDYQGFDSSFLNFPTGIGGILYPPHCFTDEVFNKNVFMDICPHADDIWFKAMSLMNGILSQKAFSDSKIENYIINEKVQNNFSLSKINNDKSMNDIQIKAVFKKYGLSRFLTEKIDDRSDFRQRNINP